MKNNLPIYVKVPACFSMPTHEKALGIKAFYRNVLSSFEQCIINANYVC